jgi:hypothetical protein
MYVPCIRLCKLIAQACFRDLRTAVMILRVSPSTYHDLCYRRCMCARRLNLPTLRVTCVRLSKVIVPCMFYTTLRESLRVLSVSYIQVSEPIALHPVPIRSRIHSESPVCTCFCITRLSEPMTLHVVPLRSRTRSQC